MTGCAANWLKISVFKLGCNRRANHTFPRPNYRQKTIETDHSANSTKGNIAVWKTPALPA